MIQLLGRSVAACDGANFESATQNDPLTSHEERLLAERRCWVIAAAVHWFSEKSLNAGRLTGWDGDSVGIWQFSEFCNNSGEIPVQIRQNVGKFHQIPSIFSRSSVLKNWDKIMSMNVS